jgi:hypothetical protein
MRVSKTSRLILVGISTFFITAIYSRPSLAFQSEDRPVTDWVPVEDEEAIRRLQFPELYPPAALLPDLRTLPPTDLLLQILRGQGITRLRFTNTIWNSGPGHLEMRAAPIPLPGTVKVFQYIYRDDGSTIFQDAGLFAFHDVHGHWHWDGFGIYRVWSLTPEGGLDQVIASSDKVGYCLIDMAPYQGDDAPVFPEGLVPPVGRQYTGCIWTYQGISAGWIDSYKSHIGGQFVDITGLPSGVYALESTVDPDNIIREWDDGNNRAVVYFLLVGETVTVLGESYTPPETDRSARFAR